VKTIVTERAASALATADASAGGQTPQVRLRDRARAVRAACRQVLGIPDYDRYLAHMAAHHPGEPVLTRRDFFAHSIDRKYGRSGPRCC
jgi:uncharacterized short protein YbdD (DUF466 family)